MYNRPNPIKGPVVSCKERTVQLTTRTRIFFSFVQSIPPIIQAISLVSSALVEFRMVPRHERTFLSTLTTILEPPMITGCVPVYNL